MKSYPIVFVLALVFIDTNALDACSDENLLTQNLVNDPVFKQCDGALANYFTTQQGLTRDALRYVIGKTTVRSCLLGSYHVWIQCNFANFPSHCSQLRFRLIIFPS